MEITEEFINNLETRVKNLTYRQKKDAQFHASQQQDPEIRAGLYNILGFPAYAKQDPDNIIRAIAYKLLGYTAEALKDKDDTIRLNAYRNLGFTEEALKDPSLYVRDAAQKYFLAKSLEEEIQKTTPKIDLIKSRTLDVLNNILTKTQKED